MKNTSKYRQKWPYKILRLQIFLFLTLVGVNVQSQIQVSSQRKKFKISDIRLVLGGYNDFVNYGTLTEFRKLAPGSTLLAKNIDKYNIASARDVVGVAEIHVGIHFLDSAKLKYKKNSVLFLGLGYYSRQGLNNHLRYTKNKYDIIYAPITSKKIYLDSVTMDNYDLNYYAGQLQLQAQYSMLMMQEKRVAAYLGFGLSAGASIYSKTEVKYEKILAIISRDSADTSPKTAIGTILESGNGTYKNKMSFGMNAYIPLRIERIMWAYTEEHQRNHLFYELRAGMNAKFIRGISPKTGMVIFHSIGYRFELD